MDGPAYKQAQGILIDQKIQAVPVEDDAGRGIDEPIQQRRKAVASGKNVIFPAVSEMKVTQDQRPHTIQPSPFDCPIGVSP